MTNNLPFDPKLAKYGDKVVLPEGYEAKFIDMDADDAVVKLPSGKYISISPDDIRLRPRMVKRIIKLWSNGTWTFFDDIPPKPGPSKELLLTQEIEVQEG